MAHLVYVASCKLRAASLPFKHFKYSLIALEISPAITRYRFELLAPPLTHFATLNISDTPSDRHTAGTLDFTPYLGILQGPQPFAAAAAATHSNSHAFPALSNIFAISRSFLFSAFPFGLSARRNFVPSDDLSKTQSHLVTPSLSHQQHQPARTPEEP